jgi:hypothetical protein
MASSLAADPLRPSAERAKSDAVTSDALCHAATPVRDLQPVTWRARPARRPGDTQPQQGSITPRPGRVAGGGAHGAVPATRRHIRARFPAAGLGWQGSWPRAPSIGWMPDIAAGPGSLAFAFARARVPDTLVARGAPAPQSRRSGRPVLPGEAAAALRRRRLRRKDVSPRLLQPIPNTSTQRTAGLPASFALRRSRRGWRSG